MNSNMFPFMLACAYSITTRIVNDISMYLYCCITSFAGTDRGLKETLKTADAVKQKKMEEAKSTSTRTVTGTDGVRTTTTTTTTKKTTGA